MRCVRLAAAVVLAATAASAGEGRDEPPSRVERLRRERLRRQQSIRPPEQGFLERQLRNLEKADRPSIFDVNYKGLYPSISSISAGSRLGPAVRLWRPTIGGSPISLHASAAFSLEGYELYDLQVGRVPHQMGKLPRRSTKGDDVYELASGRQSPPGLILYASLRYQHYPQERFFGLGPDSTLENESTFLHQDASYELVGGWQFGRHVAAILRGGYLQAFVGPGTDERVPTTQDLFGPDQAPGLLQQPDFLTGTAQLLLDYRDEPFNPHRGGLLALNLMRVDDRGGEQFAFTRFSADARAYLPLGSPQRVLALRAYTSLDDPDAGSEVPFYMQQTLGSSHLLRGFETFRFRGEKLLSLQAEYRWEAVPAVELALFADSGKVFDDISDLDFGDLEASYGFGIRIKSSTATLIRLDLAHSNERTRFFFKFGAAF